MGMGVRQDAKPARAAIDRSRSGDALVAEQESRATRAATRTSPLPRTPRTSGAKLSW